MGRYDDEGDAPRKKRRFRLMHVTMVMLSLLLVNKLTEVATATKELMSVRDAQASSEEPKEEKAEATEEKADEKEAEEDVAAEEEKAKEEGDKADEAKKEDGDEAKKEGEHEEAKEEGEEDKKPPGEEKTLGAGKLTVKEVEALKAKDSGSDYTQSELDLLQNLTKRRNELDEREKDLQLKAKVLDATEMRITGKVKEMKTLQSELTSVVAQYKQQQNGEIKSLVKIYENMKPLDAAAIFNEMDMPILLEVIDKMSERKVAPVLAGMNPKRARDVTQELAEMRRGRAALNAAAAAADVTKP